VDDAKNENENHKKSVINERTASVVAVIQWSTEDQGRSDLKWKLQVITDGHKLHYVLTYYFIRLPVQCSSFVGLVLLLLVLCQLQVLSFWWFWIMLFWRRSLCTTYAIRYIHSWSVSYVNWSLLIISLHPSPLLFSLVSPPHTLSLEISLMLLGCCSSCGKTISLECSSCVIYVHFFWSAAQQPLKIPPPPPQKLL
jgi:hypothetical protein